MGKVVVVVRWPLVALTRWPLARGCLKSKKATYMGEVVVVVRWPLVALTRWQFASGYLESKRLRTWKKWSLSSDGLWSR